MLDHFNISADERKRLLYVGMTRAIKNLAIYCNGNYLDNIKTEGLYTACDSKQYEHPAHLVMQLTYKDVSGFLSSSPECDCWPEKRRCAEL